MALRFSPRTLVVNNLTAYEVNSGTGRRRPGGPFGTAGGS
jgi:hypothetical protein